MTDHLAPAREDDRAHQHPSDVGRQKTEHHGFDLGMWPAQAQGGSSAPAGTKGTRGNNQSLEERIEK